MKRKPKILLYIVIAFFVVWPVYQIASMVGGQSETEDAGKLLYRVSLFQMELLNSVLHDVDKAKDTAALNSLRQAVYTASFTHQQLVLAYGDRKLTPLDGLTQLMQYLLRLQIAGQRSLKSEETQALVECRRMFAELYDAYGKLMSSSGGIVSSQNDRMVKTDKEMAGLLRKKLLQ